MPSGLSAIVNKKTRRNSRQQASEQGDGSVSGHGTAQGMHHSMSTPVLNRHDLMRRAMQTSTFEQEDPSFDASSLQLPGGPAVAPTSPTMSTPRHPSSSTPALPPGSLLTPGSALDGAAAKARQTAMRSPSGSTPGSPGPDAALLAAKLGPPGVIAAVPQNGPVVVVNSDASSTSSAEQPGEGSLTIESFDFASLGNNDIVHAEPHSRAVSGPQTPGAPARQPALAEPSPSAARSPNRRQANVTEDGVPDEDGDGVGPTRDTPGRQRLSRQASATSSMSFDDSFRSEFSSSSDDANLRPALDFDPAAAAQQLLSPTVALAARGGANSITRDPGTAPGNGTPSIAAGVALASKAALAAAAARDTASGWDALQNQDPGTPISKPVLTPNGIGAVGGLSPSGMGERITLERGSPYGAPGQHHHDPNELLPSQRAYVQEPYSSADLPPPVTGFAVASTKRNNAFHQIFPNIPEDDFLIEDYACALAREILVQGRLYVSENHLAFMANIFGWVTNVVIPFTEIMSIEKRMTAFVIPNAIQISTLHAKHTFTSFLSRDTAYDLIANIWRLSHPNFTTTFDAMPDFSDGESVDGQGTDSQERKNSRRQRLRDKLPRGGKSGTGTSRPTTADDGSADKEGGSKSGSTGAGGNASGAASMKGAGTPKKAAHRPTTCACEKNKEHWATVVMDTKYNAVPEKMYNLLFTSGFMKDFWQGNQKLFDLQMSDWSPDAGNNNMLSRTMSYIKPLTGSFGPKQTKCHITDENLHVDFDDYVTTMTTTKTPDVPNGGIFAVKTRTCFTWAGGNTTRIYVCCTVEWTGRTMIKGIIEKACIDGQKQYYQDLDKEIHKYFKEHASEFKEEGDEVAEDEASIDSPDGNDGKDGEASGGGSGDTSSGLSKDQKSGDASAKGKGALATYLDMAADFVSDALGMVSDAVSGASPSMLILSSIVVVLLVSNLWALTLREAPAGYRSPQQPVPRGAPTSGVALGGADGSSDALAAALREVLRDHFGPSTPGGVVHSAQAVSEESAVKGRAPARGQAAGRQDAGNAAGVGADRVDEIQQLLSLINDAESKIAKLKGELGAGGNARPGTKKKR